jgi:hypothetical protein
VDTDSPNSSKEHSDYFSTDQPGPHNVDPVELNLLRIHGEVFPPDISENPVQNSTSEPKSLLYDYSLPPGFKAPPRKDPRLDPSAPINSPSDSTANQIETIVSSRPSS